MTDVRLKEYHSLEGVTMDWLLRDNGTLDDREELATAARVALGTDALASPSDVLPDPDSTDRRGWWGDLDADVIWGGWPIGCKNWLLERAKITDAFSSEGSTVARAQNYTKDALQPFLDKRIATEMDVQAARTQLERIEVKAHIYRGPDAEIDLRYQLLWQEEPADDELPVAQQVQAPVVVTDPNISRQITIPFATLLLTRYTPRLSPTRITPPFTRIALAPKIPVVSRASVAVEIPATAALSVRSTAPIVQRSTGTLTLTAVRGSYTWRIADQITSLDNPNVTPAKSTKTLTTTAPTVSIQTVVTGSRTLTADKGFYSVTGDSTTVDMGVLLDRGSYQWKIDDLVTSTP